MIEYKKIEGMTTGQVIDLMLDGEAVYDNLGGGVFLDISEEEDDILILKSRLERGDLYTKAESEEPAWWEDFEGCLIMVRDFDDEDWYCDIFETYCEGEVFSIRCKVGAWKQARPLTAAERDAIKVVG